jgi:hypothetical protein
MDIGCNRLATVARDFYSQCGWRTDKRLTWRSCGGLLFLSYLDGWFS